MKSSSDIFTTVVMAVKEVSLVAQFDDICRGFNLWMNEPLTGTGNCPSYVCLYINFAYCIVWKEFQNFAKNQEDCRNKWKTTEEMCTKVMKELVDARSSKETLEHQVK